MRTEHIATHDGMDMLDSQQILIIGIILAPLSLFIPTIHYLTTMFLSSKIGSNSLTNFTPDLTIILPMRNESSIVESKIKEVLSYDYPKEKLEIIVLDSGSIDNTAKLARDALAGEGEVLTLQKPGKSLAINYALEIIETEFFVMMDADAVCSGDSIKKIVGWFEDECIGAVCGQQHDDFSIADPYKSRFNIMRVGESVIDSTPIFEGSICCFRTKSLSGNRINPKINADDSQLSMIVRANGFRSIMDPSIRFTEQKPISRNRQVRRSQGLSRALLSRYDLCFGYGKYSIIISSLIYFYVFLPWLIFFSFSCYLVILMNILMVNSIHEILESPENLIILMPLAFLPTKTARGFFSGITILLESHVRFFLGNSLEIWNPER